MTEHPPSRWSRWRRREGLWLTAGAALLTLLLWGRVILGQRVLIAGDILFGVPPWKGSAGAHAPANTLIGDPVLTVLPWHIVVRDALLHWHMPLWNQLSLTGSPLLGNDQTAAFFPVTLLLLPFGPAHALSLAMLVKLWIAGLGAAFFVRQLRGEARAAAFAGLAFATSSYLTVWLGYPNSTPAALVPLGFGAVEWYLRTRRPAALGLLGFTVGLMFLAGHAPSEAHLLGILSIYTAIRLVAQGSGRLRALGGLLTAGLGGLAVGAVQVLPFAEALREGVTFNLRSTTKAGFFHLSPSAIASWLLPNSHGNPAIDGLLARPPNFAESAGFAGVGAVFLSTLGIWWLWRRQRSAAVGLLTVMLVAAGTVYGPLSPIIGRLPVLAVSNNVRLVAVVCLGVAVLGGLGVEAILSPRPARSARLGGVTIAVGALALAGLAVASYLALTRRGAVDGMLPSVHGNIGFWVAVAGLSVVAAGAFIAAGLRGAGPAWLRAA